MLVYSMDGKPNYQSALRVEKLDTIELIVGKCDKESLPALKRELYRYCLEKWGTEWRKFMEYLTDLVMLKKIVIDGDDVWTWKRWQKIEKARSLDYKKMKDVIHKQFKGIRHEISLMTDNQ